jgi:hypothetical protein
VELLIARNPDETSTLPYLLRLPIGDGLVFRTKGTWPRTNALFCYPVDLAEWPADPDLVEQVPLRSCARRGAAIDVIADRGREQRSQLVFTKARGRDMVFWQSPRTRKQARPQTRLPTARAAGLAPFEIIVDAHERYAYTFAVQQVRTVRRALRSGDYAVELDGRIVAAVERKSIADLISSLTNGRLRFAVAELAGLPRAAVVVEERYAEIFRQEYVRPAQVADGVAELQVRWPNVPIMFCETRKLAEEWTYRYLAAAYAWAADDQPAVPMEVALPSEPVADRGRQPSSAEVRAWARQQGLAVADRGRLRPEVVAAWQTAHGR